MNYSQIKKLDEETQKKLQEGSGPVNKCLCSLLAPPEQSKGIRGSIRRALASMGGRRAGGGGRGKGGGGFMMSGGKNTVEIPLTFEKGGKGIFTTKEELKRGTACGKCGCDKEKLMMKTSFANIRITSPDVSYICPCPDSACMPGKDKLNSSIRVTVERVEISHTETDNKPAEDQETDEKTTQVRNRWKIPSYKNLVTEKTSLKNHEDGKILSVNESQKRPALKKPKAKDQRSNPKETTQQRRRNVNLEDLNNCGKEFNENNLKGEKTASRPRDQSLEYSESFSGRMEEQHEDVMKRPYHD